MSGEYRVAIKPTARRVSARAGEWVNREGTDRTFGSKALAREWAKDCAGPRARVWVQDAPPWAEGPADGYLVGCRPAPERDPARAGHDSEDGEQGTLAGDR